MLDLPGYLVVGLLLEAGANGADLYHGRRVQGGAPVLIKALRRDAEPHEIARLRYEHALLRDLEGPGVARLVSLERWGEAQALILELPPGRPMRALLREGPLDVRAALRVGAGLARALSALHERHVIHRDVRPESAFADPETGAVTLIELGLATRLAREEQRLDSLAALEGDLAYMAPEQTGRMGRAVDARADLYALGVTLYEALAGALPFRREDPLELLHSHVARAPEPLREVSPAIPEVVSDLVQRLLAKAPEDRYQSAPGLAEDLEECLRRLEGDGSIEPFPLGRRDVPAELREPARLHGRERELEALAAAFARASRGAAELVVVTGAAGIGKSALVRALHATVARQGGYFGAGKADPLGQDQPYAALAHALREIVRQILGERPEALSRWQERFRAALGASGRLIAGLVPEIERCVGPQPAPPPLDPVASRHRFRHLMTAFIRALCAGGVVALFIDDLQWADPATLAVLGPLLQDPGSGRLLVVAARRDDAEGAVRPLPGGAAVTEIALGPLPLEAIAALLGDALGAGAEAVAPLARVTLEKTGGNPLSVGRFLQEIARAGWLWLDAGAGAWAWDLDAIAASGAGDVLGLYARRLDALTPEARRAVELAACVGDEVDLGTLAIAAERSPAETAADLWGALAEGLLLPLDPGYRLALDPEPGAALAPSSVAFRFTHDRVRQAAYARIDEDRRKEAHLRIGRLLEAAAGGAPAEDALGAIVHHKNLGAALITGAAERAALARWDLLAARRAKAAAAYEAAADLLDVAAGLLGEEGHGDPALAREIQAELAECEYLSGRFAAAEARYEARLRGAEDDLDRALIHAARISLYQTQGRFADAIAAGRAGLALLGVALPEDEPAMRAALGAEIAAIPANLGGRRIEALIDAPALSDPRDRAVLRLLTELWTAAHFGLPALRNVVTVKLVNFSLAHGHAELSSFGYVAWCTVLARVLGRYPEARAFGQLALALHDRFPSAYLTSKLNLLYGASAHFFDPLRALPPFLEHAYQAGLAFGDPSYASFATAIVPALWMTLGRDLAGVEEDVGAFLEVVERRTRDELSLAYLRVLLAALRNLRGRTRDRRALCDHPAQEEELFAALARPGFEYGLCWAHILRLELLFLYGDHEAAAASAAEAEVRLESAQGTYLATELAYFGALARTALLGAGAEGGAAERHREALARHAASLRRWAEHCPGNFRAKHLAVLAEEARLEGRAEDAAGLYDEAIEAARAEGFLRDEAIACELAARHHLARGRRRIARAYLEDAREPLRRWGATAKLAELAERYPELYPEPAEPPAHGPASALEPPSSSLPPRSSRPAPQSSRPAPQSVQPGPDALDTVALARAAQAISGELLLDRVLDRLLRLALSAAGAARGVLLLDDRGELRIQASVTAQPEEVRIGAGAPLGEAEAELPVPLALYAARAREPAVVADALADPRLAGDPYVARERPRSALCLPMEHQGRLTGLLYLEHGAAAGVFTPARLTVLGLILAQAAFAVENARLYERLEATTAELRIANERLEDEVARRTAELERELAERARADEERARLAEAMLRAQRERLAELSTPLIPISSRVLVMPLVGTIDAERADRIVEAALRGVSERGASALILDLTGVRGFDATAARALVRAGAATRLLGAEVVATGIGPAMARTLVELGLDLCGVVTRGTLEAGIAWTQRRPGSSRGPGV